MYTNRSGPCWFGTMNTQLLTVEENTLKSSALLAQRATAWTSPIQKYLRTIGEGSQTALNLGIVAFAGVLAWLGMIAAVQADWPQFQGPTRNSLSADTGLLKQWPESGPQLTWTFKQAGEGYSSPAILGQRLYITGSRDNDEQLICLDVKEGKELWKVSIGPKFDFDGNSWGAGPRSTPSISGKSVVALGGGGNLICVDADSGKLLWSQHMMNDLGGQVNPIGGGVGSKPGEPKIGWGYTWSPLIDADRVICYPGGPQGAIAALELSTGKTLWRSTQFTAMAAYSSPIVAEIEGVKQYIVSHNGGVISVSASDGKTLWSWENEFPDVLIPTPIYQDGYLFVSGCKKCALLKIAKQGDSFQAEMVYKSKATRTMKNDVGGSVLLQGHLYGYSDKMGWVCQKTPSGDQAWVARSPLKAGSLIAADGMLICYDEDNAEVALVEANPKEFVLKSKFALPQGTANKAPGGRNWTPPVISHGCLFIRDHELLFCFKIKE